MIPITIENSIEISPEELMARIFESKNFAVNNYNAFKRILKDVQISAPQKAALNNPLTGVKKGTELGIALPITPEPLVLPEIPAQVIEKVDAMRVFFVEILPLIFKEFPSLLQLLNVDESELEKIGFEFEQRYDVVISEGGQFIIVDENSQEAGMPHVGPRLEFLLAQEEFSHLCGLDLVSFAQDLVDKFSELESRENIKAVGPIIMLTNSSPNSMGTVRNFEVAKLQELGVDIIEVSAEDILNLEEDPFKDGVIKIKGVESNRFVNLLSGNGFVANPAFKERINNFVERVHSQPNLLMLNRLGTAGKTIMSRKIDLALLSLPAVQKLVAELRGEDFLNLIRSSLPNRRILVFSEERRRITVSDLKDLNAGELVLQEIFQGRPDQFCKNINDLGLNGYIKDPFGSGGRGIVNLDSTKTIDQGTAGHMLKFFREKGLDSSRGRLFIVEDDIESIKIDAIDPQASFQENRLVRSEFTPRFEVFHSTSPTQSKVLGLSATLSHTEKVQAGGQACILPILTLK